MAAGDVSNAIPPRSDPSGSLVGDRRDPLPLFTFRVDIANVAGAFFKSVGGIKSETEVQEHFEGGFNEGVRKLIGRTKWPNLVLKQGFIGPPYDLWKMREACIKGSSARVTGDIVQLGPKLNVVCKWKFYNGIVVKWDGPDFDAAKNELAVETIEIAHEGLTLTHG